MSYHHNGNYHSSSANGGYPARGGQRNGMQPATQGHSAQHPQALHQQPQIPHQQPQILHQGRRAPPQQAPAPRPTLPPARAPPPPPIHFVLDRQYTLCRAPSPPAQPAPPTQYVPAPGAPVPHYTAACNGQQYTPARDGALYTPTRDSAHYTPTRNVHHYTPPREGARYVPPALRNVPQYTPAPAPPAHTPYAPAPGPTLVPFRCAHPQCGGRVVMVPSTREHMWAAHRVRV